MRKINIIFSILLALQLCTPAYASPSEPVTNDTIQIEYVFTSDSEDYSYNAPSDITQGENNYKLLDVKYEILTHKVHDEPLKEVVEYENLIYRQVPETHTITHNGEEIELPLLQADYTELENVESVVSETDYGYTLYPPQPPKTKPVAYTDEVTGERKVVEAQLVHMVQVEDYHWKSDVEVQGIFYGGRNVELYRINDSLIPYNPKAPEWQGYEEDILKYLQLDHNNHRITSAKWTSDFQSDDNGRTHRTAEFKGERYVARWVAIYETGDGVGSAKYNAVATYGNGVEAINQEYTIKAIATYELNNFPVVAVATTGAVAGICIIFWLISAYVIIYDNEGRRIGVTKVTKNTIDISKCKLKVNNELVTIVIKKRYAGHHVGDVVSIKNGNDTLIDYTIPMSVTDVVVVI